MAGRYPAASPRRARQRSDKAKSNPAMALLVYVGGILTVCKSNMMVCKCVYKLSVVEEVRIIRDRKATLLPAPWFAKPQSEE